jgi:DNA-binding CsgD family transcriptional regulator
MPGNSWRDAPRDDHGPRHRSGTYVYASRDNSRPNPPFLLNGVNFSYQSFAIDPRRVAPFLPPGVALTDEQIGFTALCVIDDAWSLGAFSWGFGGVVVDNHESPDGSEGGLLLFSYVSPSACATFSDIYDASSIEGETRVWDTDDIWWARTGPVAAAPHLQIGIRHESEPVTIDGIDLYLSRDGDGHLVDWTISYVGTARIGDVVAFDIADDAPPGLKAMAPTDLQWGARNTGFRGNFSAPRLARLAGDEEGSAAERAFLSLLGGHPSAALVLSADTRVRHMNAAARSLLGTAVSLTQGQLRTADVVTQQALEAAIVGALAGTAGRTPFRLVLSGMEPLIAQAFGLDPQVFGPGAVLLLVTDPRAATSRDPGPSLRLLGLTEAEARIAGAVGGGNAPRAAAGQLGLSENTVRTTLRVVYDKLGIRRQAELATLVSRLVGG